MYRHRINVFISKVYVEAVGLWHVILDDVAYRRQGILLKDFGVLNGHILGEV